MGTLKGRTALVTGAGRDVGAAVTQTLDSEGVNLGLASCSGDGLGIEGAAAKPTDVWNLEALQILAAATAERFGVVDIPVINAGVGSYGPFLELPDDESAAADLVTTAGETGRRGLPLEVVYCSSEFAQVGMTQALDHELREQGVRCTGVASDGVATDFAMGRGRTPDMSELRGMMKSEDVAEAVMYVRTRPRNHRIPEMAFRPVSEASVG